MRIIPNPPDVNLRIERDMKDDMISIFEMTAALVHKETSTESRINIDLARSVSGIYVVRSLNSKAALIKKIIIEQ